MTDEERTDGLTQKAKESYKIYSGDRWVETYEGCHYIDGYCNGYEQGYEDCRHYAHEYYKPKWHDLKKKPDDLPKESGEYWGYVNYFGFQHRKIYWSDNRFDVSEVIAWCETPKFKG